MNIYKLLVFTIILGLAPAALLKSWVEVRNDTTTPAVWEIVLKEGSPFALHTEPGEKQLSHSDRIKGPAGNWILRNLYRVKQVIKIYVQDSKIVSREYYNNSANKLIDKYAFIPLSAQDAQSKGVLLKKERKSEDEFPYAVNDFYGLCKKEDLKDNGECTSKLSKLKDEKSKKQYSVAQPTILKTCNVNSCGGFSQYYDLTVDLGIKPPKFDLKSKVSLEKTPGSGKFGK